MNVNKRQYLTGTNTFITVVTPAIYYLHTQKYTEFQKVSFVFLLYGRRLCASLANDYVMAAHQRYERIRWEYRTETLGLRNPLIDSKLRNFDCNVTKRSCCSESRMFL